MKKFILIIVTFVGTLSCNKTKEIAPQILLETVSSGATTGAAIVKVIGAEGGNIDIPTANARVIVPAGAMAAGASLSITPTKDPLDNEGEGLRVDGAWTKPITVEYRITDTEAGNYRLYAKLPNGLWVGSAKTKVTGSTVSVRLGANSGATVKNGRTSARQYDLAFAKDFYLKPNSASLDLGQSETFTAYAREGKVPYKYKGSDGKMHYVLDDDEDIVPLAPKPIDDDEPVPLAPSPKNADEDDVVPLARSTAISDDDEVVPLAVHVKEYAFANTKAGFNRSWKVGKEVGNIDTKGKFTATNNTAAKGLSSMVEFTSVNITTQQAVNMTASVRIKGGPKRLIGKIKISKVFTNNYVDAYKMAANRIINAEMEAIVIVEQDPKVTGWESYNLQQIKIVSANETSSDIQSFRSDESTTQAPGNILVFDKSSNLKHGSVLLNIYPKDDKHSLSFYLYTGDVCSWSLKTIIDGKASSQSSSTHGIVLGSDHDTNLKFSGQLNGKNIEKRNWTEGLSKKEQTLTYEWSFSEEK